MSGSNNIWPNGTEMPVKPGVKLLGDDGSQTGDVPVEHLLWAEHLGKAGGVASLGNDGKLPLSQIPVDLTGDLENTQDQIAEISGKVDGAVEAAGTEARRIASSVATQTTNAALTDQVPQRLNPYIEAAEQSKQSALAAEIDARQHSDNATDAAADASGYKSEAYNAQIAAERAQRIAEDASSRASEADRQAAEARAGAVAARTAAEDARRLAEAAQADALGKAQAALAAQEAAVSAQRATEVASGDVGQAKADTIAARDAAEGAKQVAEAAKASAVESSRVAQGAKDAAQVADATANEAKLRAIDASTAADNSRIVAVNAAESASASRQAAEIAKSAVERVKANVDTLAQNANMSAQQAAQSAAAAVTDGVAAGTSAGAKAGADAIKPYFNDVVLNTQAAAASAKTAGDNAAVAFDKQAIASQAAIEADASKKAAFNSSQDALARASAADMARAAAEAAVASTNANATGSAITVLTRVELDALTSIPGTNPAQPLRALLLATVVSEGKNYRRDANNTAWVFESSNLPVIEQRIANQESLVKSREPTLPGPLWALKDEIGNIIMAMRQSGALGILAGDLAKGDFDGLRVRDEAGNAIFQIDRKGLATSGGTLTSAGVLSVIQSILAPLLRSRSIEVPSGGDGIKLLDSQNAAKGVVNSDGFNFPGGSLSLAGVLSAISALSLPKTQLGDNDKDNIVVRDENGAVAVSLGRDGFKIKGFSVDAPGKMLLGDLIEFRQTTGTNSALRIVDDNGWVAVRLGTDGILRAPVLNSLAPVSTAFTAADIAQENARCRAASGEAARTYRGDISPLTAQILHFIIYGQSLSVGYEGYPPVTKTQSYDNLMAGLSVHGNVSGTTWTQYGPADFYPLVGTVRGGASGVMTPAEIAALPVTGDGSPGETVGEGALNFLRRAYLDSKEVTATSANPYNAHRFLVGECGAGGQPIETLSKGNSLGLYDRVLSMATKVKAMAVGKNLSYGVAAYLWLQGEANYDTSGPNVYTKEAYKALLKQLVLDLNADVTKNIAGQDRPAAFFTYQTSATYVKENPAETQQINLGPSMAQWEIARDEPSVIMVGPQYPVTDKRGHLTANGYRWLGEQFGKVMYRVLMLKQDWKPLGPNSVKIKGRQILIGYDVPRPPLKWGFPYGMNAASKLNLPTDYNNKGFVIVDDAGTLTDCQVNIVGDCVVMVTMSRDPVGQVYVKYGSNLTEGVGCLCDSDDTPSSTLFTYLPQDGAGAPDNVPGLINKPYPLMNFSVIYHLPATPV